MKQFFSSLTLITFSLFVLNSTAQEVNNYLFSSSSGTYTAISGTQVPGITSTNTNNGMSSVLALPFSFRYCGINYVSIRVSTNGYIVMGDVGNDNPSNSFLTGGANPNKNVIAPLWDDLDIVSPGNLTYKTTGTAPDRVFTIQWSNVKWDTLATGGSNFQIKLYEGSNHIEFCYGTSSPFQASASIGIIGECNGNNYYISVIPGAPATTVSAAYGSGSTPAEPPTVSANTNLASGTVYKFSAPSYTIGSGDWNSASTWFKGLIPTASSIVVINNGNEINIPDGYNAVCKRLILGGDHQITSSTNTAVVSLSGTGTLTVQNDLFLTTADVSSIPVANTNDYASLLVHNAQATIKGNVYIAGINSNAGSGFALMNSSIIVEGGGVLNVNGNISNGSSSCRSLANSISSSESKVDLSTGNATLNIGGNIASSINLLLGSGGNTGSVVNFNGTGTQTINHTDFQNLKINNKGGGVSANLAVSAKNIYIGDEMPAAVLRDNGFQLSGSINGVLTISDQSKLIIGGSGTATLFPVNFTRNHITLASNSIVEYNSNLDQTVSTIPVYGNLNLTRYGDLHDKKTAKTITGNLDVTKTLKITSVKVPDVLSGSTVTSTDEGYVKTIFTGSGTSTVNIDSMLIEGANNGKTSYTGSGDITFNIRAFTKTGGGLFVGNEGTGNAIYKIAASVDVKGEPQTSSAITPPGVADFTGDFILGNSTAVTKMILANGNFTKRGHSGMTIRNAAGLAMLDIQNGNLTIDTGTKNNINIINAAAGDSAFVHVAKDMINNGGASSVASAAFSVNTAAGKGSLVVDGNFTDNSAGSTNGGTSTGTTRIWVKGNFVKNAGTLHINKGSGGVQLEVDANFTNNSAGNINGGTSTGASNILVKGNFVKNAGVLNINTGSGGVQLEVDGNFNHVAGNMNVATSTGTTNVVIKGNLTKTVGVLTLGVDNNTQILMSVQGDMVNNGGNIVLSSGTSVPMLLVNGNLQHKANDFIAAGGSGHPVMHILKDFSVLGGNFFGSKQTRGFPECTIEGNFLVKAANFYALNSDTTGNDNRSTPNFVTYNINGTVEVAAGGLLVGTASKNSNVFNMAKNFFVNGGTVACSQQAQKPTSPTAPAIPPSGNPVFNVGGDITVSSGLMYLTNGSSQTVGGGESLINVQGSFLVNGSGKFYGIAGNPNSTSFNGRIVFKNKSVQDLTEYQLKLNKGFATGNDTLQYNIFIESLRIVKLMDMVTLGDNKSFKVNGKLITNGFNVMNGGSAPFTATGTTFELSGANGFIDISSPDGITQTAALGNVQTNTRKFESQCTYKYSCAANQSTGNAIPAHVKTLLAINTPALTLAKHVTVTNNFNILSDNTLLVTITDSGRLTIAAGAVVENLGPQRFVRGNLEKVFGASENSFQYDVGEVIKDIPLFYRPVTIKKTTDNPSICVKLVYKNPNANKFYINQKESSIEAINNHYYYWMRRQAGTNPVDITLSYEPTDSGIFTPSGLNIAAWKDTQSWKNLNATVDESKKTVTALGFNNFQQGSIGSTGLVDTTPVALCGIHASNNYAPLAAFFHVSPVTTCVNDTVIVTDLSPGFPDSFQWNFGSGATPAIASTRGPHKVVYSTTGPKTISLIVGKLGSTPNADDTLIVAGADTVLTPPVTEPFDPTDPTSVCKGDTAIFTLQGAISSDSYVWSANNGATVVSGNGSGTVRIAFPQSGSITVSVYKYNNGCRGTTRIRTVTVKKVDLGDIIGNIFVCPNGTESYTVDADAGATFLWTVSGGTVIGSSVDNAINVQWGNSGKGTVRITKSKNSCSESKMINIGIGALTADAGSDQSICSGQSANLSVSFSGASGSNPSCSFSWKLKDGTQVSTQQTITVSPAKTTKYYIQVRDNNCSSNTSIDSVVVTVSAPITINAMTGNTSICQGSSINLNVSVSGGKNIYTYKWSPSTDLSNDAINNPTASPKIKTTYHVKISDGCSADIDSTVTVNVLDTPVISFVISPIPPTDNDSIAFTASDLNTSNYVWDFGDGKMGTGAIIKHKYAIHGKYTVVLTLDTNGCPGTYTKEIDVRDFSGIESITQGSFDVYPNPSDGKINVQFQDAPDDYYMFKLFDVQGKLVSEQKIHHVSGSSLIVDYSTVSAGYYILQIQSENFIGIRKINIVKDDK